MVSIVKFFKDVVNKAGSCYFCRIEEDLCVHHIDLDHYNNNPDNLVVLCHRCHGKIHGFLQIMGIQKRNYSKEDDLKLRKKLKKANIFSRFEGRKH